MKSTLHPVEHRFKESLSSLLGAGAAGSSLITAFSGGPDSTVLLFLLSRFRRDFKYSLTAAYVDHGIRSAGEMAAERDLVEQNARMMGVPLRIKVYPAGFLEDYAGKTGTGVEAAARTWRYRFFRKLQARDSSSLLVLGHNRDDQLETLVMRIFQGTSPAGLRGIPERGDRLVRPLLGISREEIMAYAEEQGLTFSIDSTNLTGVYRRNRIRQEFWPVVKNIFPEPERALLALCRDVCDIQGTGGTDRIWRSEEAARFIPAADFFSLPPSLRRSELLEQMNGLLRGILPPDTRIPGRFLNPLEGECPAGDRVILSGYGIRLFKKGEQLCLQRAPGNKTAGLFHVLSEENPYQGQGLSVAFLGDQPAEEAGLPVPSGCCLTIRNPRKGEKIPGTGKVCEGDWLVLCGRGRVLYMVNKAGKVCFSHCEAEKKGKNNRIKNAGYVIINVRG